MHGWKKKVAIWSTFWGILFLVSSPVCVAAQTKIGYVISQKILMESDAGQDFIVQKEKLEEKKKQEILNTMDELKQLGEEIRSKQMFLNMEAKEELQEEIQGMEKKIERLKEDSVAQLKKFVKNAMRKMNEEASKIIMDIGTKEKYDIIVDINSRANNVVYINPESDITDRVIDLYNQKHKAMKEKK